MSLISCLSKSKYNRITEAERDELGQYVKGFLDQGLVQYEAEVQAVKKAIRLELAQADKLRALHKGLALQVVPVEAEASLSEKPVDSASSVVQTLDKGAADAGPAQPSEKAPEGVSLGRDGLRGVSDPGGDRAGGKPQEGAARGGKTSVHFPPASKRKPLKAQYQVVELDSLKPSHSFGSWQKSEAWTPAEHAQQRDYTGGAMKAVREGVATEPLSPDHVLMHTGDAGNGPPIIDQNGIVLGGNNRSHRIAENYRKGDPAGYKAQLQADAAEYGIDPEAVAGMSRPVLVRSVETAREDNPGLIAALNESPTNALDAAAAAANRGAKVGSRTAEALSGIGDMTLNKYLDENGQKVVQALIADGVFKDTDLPGIFNFDTGKWEKGGKEQVIQALFGGIVPDATILSGSPPAFVNKLIRSLPELVRLKKRNSPVLADIPEALRLATAFATKKAADPKITIARFGKGGETDMFTGKVDEDKAGPAWELFQAIHGMNQIETKEHFRKLADEAAGIGGSLFDAIPGFNEEPAKGGKNAMSYRYAGPSPTIPSSPSVFSMLDLVDLSQKILKTPDVLRRLSVLGGQANGLFRSNPMTGKIELRADIAVGPVIREGLVRASEADALEPFVMGQIMSQFPELDPNEIEIRKERTNKPGMVMMTFLKKDPDFAAKVLAHEIGHAADWLPDRDMGRGNILGRIASLNDYLSHMIEGEMPEAPDENWLASQVGKDEWKRLRAEMYKEAGEIANGKADKREDPEGWADVRAAEYQRLQKEWRESMGFITKQDVMGELKALSQWWKPFDEDLDEAFTKYRYSSKELYADAVSVLLNDPNELVARAPLFYSSFMSYLVRKPEVMKAYKEISAMIAAGGSVENAGLKLQKGFARGNAVVLEQLEREAPSFREAAGEFSTGVIDANWMTARAVKWVERNVRPIAPEKNPDLAYEGALYTGSEEGAYWDAMRRNLDAISIATKMPRGVVAEIIYHNRVVKERSLLFNPEGFNSKTSQERLVQLGQRFGTDNVAAVLEFWKLNHESRQKDLLGKPEVMEMFSDDLLEKMMANDAYARFSVVDYMDGEHGAGTGGKIFKQIGTLKSVADPILATAMQDASIMWTANWNAAKLRVVDFLTEFFPDEIQKAESRWVNNHNEFLEPKDKDLALMLVMKKGKLQGYYVSKFVANAYQHTRSDMMKNAAGVMRLAQGLFRGLYVTWNVGFLVSNASRDLFRAGKHLPEGWGGGRQLKYLGLWLRAMKDTFGSAYFGKNVEDLEQLKRDRALISEGSIMGMVDDAAIADERLRAMIDLDFGAESISKKDVKQLTRGALTRLRIKCGKLLSAVEWAPKLAMARYLEQVAPGMSPLERAEIIRRAGSPKFLRKGAEARLINSAFIFMNPMVQAWREDMTLWRDKPGDQALKMGLYVLGPKFLQWAATSGALAAAIAAMGGDDEWAKYLEKMMKNISERVALRNYVVPLYLDANDKTVALRLAQDQNDALISGLFWIALDGISGKDHGQSAPSRATKLLWDSIKPELAPAVQILADATQYAGGINPDNDWTGKKMVPDSLFKANTWDTHAYFARQMWNKYGGGAIGYFRTRGKAEAQTGLDQFLGLPGVSATLGRLLFVSDYGKVEDENDAKAVKEREDARERETRRLPSGKLQPKPHYSQPKDPFGNLFPSRKGAF